MSATREATTPAALGDAARTPVLLLAALIATFVLGASVPFLVTLPATLLLAWALLSLRPGAPAQGPTLPYAHLLAWGGPLLMAALSTYATASGATRPVVVVTGVVLLGTSLAAAHFPRLFGVHLAVAALQLVVLVRTVHPPSDVQYMVGDSVAALLRGVNPYGLTFPNPYTVADTARFWNLDFISGDRIDVGYPYLPAPLLVDVPGHLLGDIRYASVLALLGATALAWRVATEPVGRLLVATLPATPLALRTTLGYWVEPVMVLGLVLLVWAMVTRRRWAGVLGGVLLLSTKQYAVVLLPLERLVRERLGARTVWVLTGVVAALIGGFFLLDPRAFWRAVVELHLSQPYRSDSISLATDLVDAGLPVPVAALSVASVVAGLCVALLVRWRAPAGAAWLALGTGLALLATVLLSKQAFINYYFVIHAALVLALAARPRESRGTPVPDRA